MRRTGKKLLLASALSAVLIATALPARAGGSWFDVDDGVVYVGETLTVRAEFSNGSQAAVSDGPWSAYLRPDESTSSTDDLYLGPVTISEGACCPFVAELTFTVPDVTLGGYWVDVRNPDGEGVGDLIGGFITIAGSAEEAALLGRIERLRERLYVLKDDLRYERETAERVSSKLDAARAEATQLQQRVRGLEAELVRVRDTLAREHPSSSFPWLAVAFATIAGFSLGIGVVSLKRRRGRLRVPDSPAELLREGALR